MIPRLIRRSRAVPDHVLHDRRAVILDHDDIHAVIQRKGCHRFMPLACGKRGRGHQGSRKGKGPNHGASSV